MLALSAGSVQAPADLKDRILRQAEQTGQLQEPVVLRPRPAKNPRRWQLAGLAAACIVLLVAASVVLQQLNQRTDRLNQQEIVVARQQEALDIISSDSSVELPMTATEDGPGTEGKVFVNDDQDAAAVLVRGLADPGDGVYTLWLIAEGDPEPVEDFVPDDAVTVIKVDRPVDSEATLAVTREPSRGNTSPRGPVLIAASRA
jgi:hypothetical protein